MVLLLHGITSSAWTWWRVAPTLAAQGYHVYALDLPGHGESTATDDHRIDAIAALVGAAIRALGLLDIVLIGHSWGGAITLALASGADPSRSALQRVVIIDPAMAMDAVWGTEALPRYLEGVGMAAETSLTGLRAANPDWAECDVIWKADALQRCQAAAVRGFFAGSGTWELTPRLAQVDVPLLMLIADPRWTVLPPVLRAAAEATLRPGLGKAVVVPGTNHNMLRGGYAQTMPVLLAWLHTAA